MRYSQPYGTPQPPIGVYPRYVNGNPVTGIEGSIPPATAFDEDQIEIDNVIRNAGLIPDHGDLTQLWQALQALFAQRYITTSIVKTVHGPGADFPDMRAAMSWLSSYLITQTGFVTFMCAAGKFIYNAPIEINHPNASRIAIQAAPLLGGTPAPGNLSVTGYHDAGDGTNQITYLRSVHATEFSFAGGVNGFVVQTPGTTIRYLLITGSQTVASGPSNIYGQPQNGNGIVLQNDLFVDGVSIWGFGGCAVFANNSTLYLASSLSLVCAYCGWQGMSLLGGNVLATEGSYVILVSNAVSGLTLYGGKATFSHLDVRGHGPPSGNAAVQCEEGGLLSAEDSTVAINGNGVICAGAATINMPNGNFNNNQQYGLYAYGQATVWVNNSHFIGNGTNSILATKMAYVEALGCDLRTPSSPLPNAVDQNVYAYIYM